MRTKCLPYPFIFLLLLLGNSCKKDKVNNPDYLLNISRTNIEVGNDVGYTDTVVVQSNTDWTVSLSDGANTWLSVDPVAKSKGDSTILTIKVIAANTAGAQTATLTVTQAGSNTQSRQINITRKTYSLVWQKCYGGSDYEELESTVVLANGQFVSTGVSYSVDGDLAGSTVQPFPWTLRGGSDGSKIWQKKDGPLDAIFKAIAASADGGTVSLGSFSAIGRYSDYSAVKFDASGNALWKKTYGGTLNELPENIITTADGGYLTAGVSSRGDGDFVSNMKSQDVWLLKLDANGDVVWQKTFGGTEAEAYATAAACSDGGYIALGYTESNNTGDVGINHGKQDFLVVKTDANGNKIWSKTIGGSGTDLARAAMSDTDGGSIIVGNTNSTDGDVIGHSGIDADTWVVKLTKDGQIGWQTLLGGSGNDGAQGIVRLPNGNIAILCTSNSTDRGITGNHGLNDVWVVVLNNRGKLLWQKAFGSSASDGGVCINAGPDGSILVTGFVTGNDGDISGYHGGGGDGWIFKLQ